MSVVVETLTGSTLEQALPALAKLRITVFRAWPYLYEGALEYEAHYLSRFAAADDAVIVAARDGDEIVGAATAAPLRGHTDSFVPLFEAHGFNPDTIFYFGESVLLPGYRGRGIGHAFFDWRENHARKVSGQKATYTRSAFCGVIRPQDHPMRPEGYRPLDAFWTKRGYHKVDGMIGSLTWKDLDQTEETAKPMQFWMKLL